MQSSSWESNEDIMSQGRFQLSDLSRQLKLGGTELTWGVFCAAALAG
jgi:hypothetical protein